MKAKKESSDEITQPPKVKTKNTPWPCGDLNHLTEEFPKSLRNNNQRAFIGGVWSDSRKNEKENSKDETCLVAQVSNEICLGINLEPDEWIEDSGCSKHMTGNQRQFSTYQAYNGGNINFRSNLSGNIIGKDTNKVPSNESQRNTTTPSVVVSDSSATDCDLVDESSVCSTPIHSLKKLDGAEPVYGPKTIKSMLKSKSTFKAKTLKGITVNEPSSAPARGKSSSASKTNSAPSKDDPRLAIVMKELNELKLQINKKKSSYARKKCSIGKRTNHKTCDHAEFLSSMNANQHHTSQGEFSSRSRPSRPLVSFSSCIHHGYNDHHSNDCLYYPTCEICRSYDHDTHGHNKIISLRRGINHRNPQHVTKNCKMCGSNVHTTSVHNDIEWFRKRKTLQAKNDSSNALRPKTPTKRKPFTKSPNMYKEYLAEFWYSTKALENTKVFFSISTCGIFGELGVNTFRNAIGAHYLPHYSENVAPPSIDVEDIIIKLKKKQREKVIPYTQFLSLLIMHKMKEGYKDDEPGPQIGHMKPLTSSKQPYVSSNEETKCGTSKEPTSFKTDYSKKRKVSSLAMDSNLSHPLVFTLVNTRMHKEDQQATGGPTSLEATSEARANPQLSSGNDASAASTAEADPGNYAPSDFVPQQQDQTKSISEGLETILTQPITRKRASSVASQIKKETFSTIKLEDLAKDEHIKKDKVKKALSSEEAMKESIESDYDDDDDENYLSGSMVESSRIKKVKKFDFVTKDGKHIHLTEEQIN
nr:retrovirus-related Pol polyprotein from transposon TNT 1-94 [Tanacetum cinerariifolium]